MFSSLFGEILYILISHPFFFLQSSAFCFLVYLLLVNVTWCFPRFMTTFAELSADPLNPLILFLSSFMAYYGHDSSFLENKALSPLMFFLSFDKLFLWRSRVQQPYCNSVLWALCCTKQCFPANCEASANNPRSLCILKYVFLILHVFVNHLFSKTLQRFCQLSHCTRWPSGLLVFSSCVGLKKTKQKKAKNKKKKNNNWCFARQRTLHPQEWWLHICWSSDRGKQYDPVTSSYAHILSGNSSLDVSINKVRRTEIF